ncbi:MAG: NifB/NifX family molybdenum-iron cluster-binding protein [Bacteroidota bacterium]|nr:NifB/NifX family molybdenum-iron cluster-binding protein [Bacteroidota bacterium]
MNLKFAFAVDNNGDFLDDHFGEADKYLIYKEIEGTLVLISEELNSHKNDDESHEHGLKKKGNALSSMLMEKQVNVLVAKQFGRNVKIVSKHFIPVLISSDQPKQAIETLGKYIYWLKDEWEKGKDQYKLFTMKSGILKSAVKETDNPE